MSNGKYLFEENTDINIMQLFHVAAKFVSRCCGYGSLGQNNGGLPLTVDGKC